MKNRIIVALIVLVWCAIAFASSTSKVISGGNSWSDPISTERGARLNVSIGSYNATTSMTITLQRKLPGDTSWGREVDKWAVTGTSSPLEYITQPEVENGVFYRIGCASGDYTSGYCTVRLGGGRK